MDLQRRFNDGETITFDRPTVVLASASPRRARHMDAAGIKYVKIISPVDDTIINYQHKHDDLTRREARRYARAMAMAKLEPFIGRVVNGAVVTADTSAYCDGRILEKPLTREKCRENHEYLSGKRNTAYTSYAIYFHNGHKGKTVTYVKGYTAKCAPIPPGVIEQICNEPEILDCAGYRIAGQIANYMKFRGSHAHNNTKGLDTRVVQKLLKRVGFTKCH